MGSYTLGKNQLFSGNGNGNGNGNISFAAPTNVRSASRNNYTGRVLVQTDDFHNGPTICVDLGRRRRPREMPGGSMEGERRRRRSEEET